MEPRFSGCDEELEAVNHGKLKRPYKLTESHIRLLMAMRYLIFMPYRQLDGPSRVLNL